MQVTRAADYAVRVMLQLATLPDGSRTSRADLARAADAPPTFVAKILQQLVDARLVTSHAGRGGGFEMARPSSEVSLLDIVSAIDGPICLNHCMPPTSDCQRSSWCSAHPVWAEAQAALTRALGGASLDRLAREQSARMVPPAVGAGIPAAAVGSPV